MAATADSPSNHHSPGGSQTTADDLHGRGLHRTNLSSPWAQVVRGDSELMPAVNHSPPSPSLQTAPPLEQTPSSDCSASKMAPSSPPPDHSSATETSDGGNSNAGGRSKKPAWSKPSNGVLETYPVMDAVYWPALSESTKASSKLPSDSSSKPAANGSISIPQELPSNAKSISAPNHTNPAPQRSTKRGGGGGNSADGHARSGFTHPPPPLPPPPSPPPFPVFTVPLNSYGNQVPIVPDPSLGESSYRSNNWEARAVGGFVPQPRAVIDHHNSSRRGNFVPQPRGDSPHYNNTGGRRDSERGNYSHSRDSHLQQQRPPPRGFVRHPSPYSPAFFAPQSIRPFGNPMAFPDFVYGPPLHEPFRAVPFMLPPPMLLPFADPNLPALILAQIEYYFSDVNLCKDDFLKSKMDDQGWVPIALIAGFPRVKNLTHNIQLIVESLRVSTVVEVQDDKFRRRNDWMRFMSPLNKPAIIDSAAMSPGESSNSINRLSTSFQKITVGEADNQSPRMGNKDLKADNVTDRSTTELPAGHSQLPNGDVNPSGSSHDRSSFSE